MGRGRSHEIGYCVEGRVAASLVEGCLAGVEPLLTHGPEMFGLCDATVQNGADRDTQFGGGEETLAVATQRRTIDLEAEAGAVGQRYFPFGV